MPSEAAGSWVARGLRRPFPCRPFHELPEPSASVLRPRRVTQGHGSSQGHAPHFWRESPRRGGGKGAPQGCRPGPQHGPSCRQLPAAQADHAAILPGASQPSLPVPRGPFAHGVRRASPGPRPSRSLRSTNLHLWLSVLMFYPTGEHKALRERRVRTSCPAWMGKLRHGEGKGRSVECCARPKPSLANPAVPQQPSFHGCRCQGGWGPVGPVWALPGVPAARRARGPGAEATGGAGSGPAPRLPAPLCVSAAFPCSPGRRPLHAPVWYTREQGPWSTAH